MDEQEDIKPAGEPQDGDDGYPRAEGARIFGDNSGNLPIEDDAPSAEEVLKDVDEVDRSLQEAAKSTSRPEDAPTGDLPDIPEAGDPSNTSPPPEPPPPAPEPDQLHEIPVATPKEAGIATPDPDIGGMEGSIPGDSDEAPPPSADEMDSTQSDLESFGEQVQAFNEAGGVGGGSASISDYGGSGEDGGGDEMQQAMDADYGFASQATDMLTEHARRMDMLTNRLEVERL